jgi:hypothetical protein
MSRISAHGSRVVEQPHSRFESSGEERTDLVPAKRRDPMPEGKDSARPLGATLEPLQRFGPT